MWLLILTLRAISTIKLFTLRSIAVEIQFKFCPLHLHTKNFS